MADIDREQGTRIKNIADDDFKLVKKLPASIEDKKAALGERAGHCCLDARQ